VHSSVGSTGTMHSWIAGKELCQRFLKLLLYPGPDLLDLPPLIGGSVVSDGEFEFMDLHPERPPAACSRRVAVEITLQQDRRSHLIDLFLARLPADIPLDQKAIGLR
jgi:hypothetical protein